MNSAAVFKEIDNPSAAWLYWHVCFWHKKPGGVDFRGRHWVFGNYESWEEKTGMSYRQLHRNFAWLRAKGWLETCKGDDKVKFALLVRPSRFPGGVTVSGQTLCPQTVTGSDLKGPNHNTENPSTEIPDIEVPQPPTGASGSIISGGVETFSPVDFPTPQSPPPQKLEAALPHSVHDVQGLVAAHKKVHQPDSGAALAQVWQIGMKEHVPNAMIVVSVKEMGMLKNFAKHCEHGTAEAVLQLTLAEWIGFTKFCEQEAGAYKTPGTPALWFLVKYAQQAVTFYLQKTAKPTTAPASINPNPVYAQLIAVPQEPAQKLGTLEDLLAPLDPDAALKD